MRRRIAGRGPGAGVLATGRHHHGQDFYFRLNVIRLRIPPLRSRREDIAPLAESFVTSLAARLGVRPRALSPGAVRRLRALSLPGNVRELKTIIERVLVLEDAPVIQAADIDRAAGGGVIETADPFARTLPLAEAKRQLESRYLRRQFELQGRSVKHTAAALGILPNNLSRRAAPARILGWSSGRRRAMKRRITARRSVWPR